MPTALRIAALAPALALLLAAVRPAAAQESAPRPLFLKLEFDATRGPAISLSSGEMSVSGFDLGGAPLRWPAEVAYDDVPREPARPAPGRRVTATALDSEGRPRVVSVRAQANLLEIDLNGLDPGEPWVLRAKLIAGPLLRMRANVPTSFPAPILTNAVGDPDAACDMAFDRARDRLYRLFPAGSVSIGRAEEGGARTVEWRGRASATGTANGLQLEVYYDALRRRLNLPPGSVQPPRFDRPPAGWRSWYAYGAGVDEAAILAEAAALRAKLAPYGLRVVQVDDGWQASAAGARVARVWTPSADRFRNGLTGLARSLRESGFRPGLWWVPQAAGAAADDAPGLLRDADSAAVDGGWAGARLWSGADPAGLARIRESAEALAGAGFEHFTIDAQPAVLEKYRGVDGDEPQHLVASKAYRATVEEVRKALGPDRFLASAWGGETAPFVRAPVDAAGLFDSLRTGRDVEATRRGFLLAADAVGRGGIANGLAWWADPDALLVGGELTLDVARSWASLVSLSGQSLFLSEKVRELPESKLEVLRRALPTLPIRELRWDERIERPRLVRVWKEREGETSLVTGHFTYDRREPAFAGSGDHRLSNEMLAAEKLEFWSGRFIGRAMLESPNAPLAVEPGSCAVVASRAARPHPFVLSTSRHVTQGWIDVSAERFDEATSTLSGISEVVAGDPYELRIVAPTRAWHPIASEVDGLESTRTDDGRVTRLRFMAPQAQRAHWRVRFAKSDAAPAASRPAPDRVRAEVSGDPSVCLTWTEGARVAGAYLVRRFGQPIATVVAPRFVDHDVVFNRKYAYEVVAVDDEGGQSAPAAAEAFTQQPPRVRLSSLEHVALASAVPIVRADLNASGGRLTIGGREHGTGFGVQAPMRIDVPLNGIRGRLTALFGIDDAAKEGGAASLRVLLDGREMAKTSLLRRGAPPVPVAVDIYEAGTLTLEFEGEDGAEGALADLVDASIQAFP